VAAESGGSLLSMSRGMRRDLLRMYGGDATAAAVAVEQLCEEPEVLSAWATRMLRREDPHARAFTWTEIPASMHRAGARGMAMAYLLCEGKAERSPV
jgi:hypothetical protein